MSDHKYHITNLTPELMQQYLDGSLAPSVQHQVERYLLDHPFEAEAMEGKMSMGAIDFEGDVEKMTTQLPHHKEERVIPLWQQYWKVAAVITLLVASTFLVLEYSKDAIVSNGSELALNKEPVSDTIKEEKDTEPEDAPASDTIESKEEDAPASDTTESEEEDLEELQEVTKQEREEFIREADKKDVRKADKSLLVLKDIVMDDIVAESIVEEEITSNLSEVKQMENEKNQASPMITEADVSQAASGAAMTRRNKSTKASNTPLRTITGKITSYEDGSALPGVNVVISGTTEGTITDLDGNYELVIPEGQASLIYSFIGHTSEEVEIGARNIIDMQLSADVQSLSEVVVTTTGVERSSKSLGYATSKKKKAGRKLDAIPIGGFEAYHTYLLSSLQYPQEALDNNITGTVVVAFTITENGELTDFEIVESLGHGCDKEAIRLVKEGRAWLPARKRDKAIEGKAKVEVIFGD